MTNRCWFLHQLVAALFQLAVALALLAFWVVVIGGVLLLVMANA